jgi:pimeloyl-ACP methyl ester carboxylesterase
MILCWNLAFVGAFTPPINYFRANGFSLSSAESKPKKDVEVPGLYMFGEHDGHLVFDHLWAAQNRQKNLKVQMVKGASHYAQQDDPEKVNTIIRDFLKIRQPKVSNKMTKIHNFAASWIRCSFS